MLLASCEANLERLEIESGEDLQAPGESAGFLFLVAKGSFRCASRCPRPGARHLLPATCPN